MTRKYIDEILQKTTLNQQEAIWLLEHVIQKKYIHFSEIILSQLQHDLLLKYIDLISNQHMPLSYIIGWVPFLGLKIFVKPPILIPRAETEEWVDLLIQKLSSHVSKISRILEIGTGSGAIGLALAKKLPKAQIWASDINSEALNLAQKNAVLNNIENIHFIKSDLFESLMDQKFDLIVSNPPYIPEKHTQTMAPSVLNWEDPKALFAGKEGLNILAKLLKQAPDYLKINGLPFQLVLEIDRSQYQSIVNICFQSGWNCTIQKDLFGNWRTVWCQLKKAPL